MKGKIVFITGASSGIGEGCARKFASQGSDLILNARNVAKLEELKKELETKYGVRVCLLPFDVRDRKAASAALASLPEEWKNIDVLVNNAGLVIGVDKEFEGNLDEWDIMIDTNIKALLAITRMVVPGMVETNFTVVRYRGDKDAADAFYKGIRPLTGDDIAETVYYAASAPEHIQIAEVLVMPTYQATGTISYRKKDC